MLSLQEAQAAIAQKIPPCTQQEELNLAQAAGRYLAAPVAALTDNPAFDNSAMDGYAANSVDLAAKGFRLPLRGESRCGSVPAALAPGTAMRIFTGAPLPQGADCIAIQENVTREGEAVRFPKNTRVGAHIRRRGEDFRAGDLLYERGRRLAPHDLALLSAAGVARVAVCRRPRALVVATGDELVAPGAPLQPGQIYESNRLATLLLLRELGAEAVDGGTVGDDAAALRELLAGARDYDFIVTSGGVSVGDHDLVKEVFAEIGEIGFWRARIKPGKPVAFGQVGERGCFFALPGNPVSSLVTFKLFVEPAVVAWHGGRYRPLSFAAVAANGFERHAGRQEYLRARLYNDGGRTLARVLPGQGSHQIGTLRETNGFIVVDADSRGFAAGDTVHVMPLCGHTCME